MTGITFRDDIKKFWAGHLATQNRVREGWERLKKKKLGSQEILSQPKQRSQHVSWSLEYGKIRKKCLACPPQIRQRWLQSQLEFGKYKNNTSSSLKDANIYTIQHWNSENTKTILQIPSRTQISTPFNTGIRKIRKKIHDMPHSNIRFGQLPRSENPRRSRGPQNTNKK
jgi:hypothetical protein